MKKRVREIHRKAKRVEILATELRPLDADDLAMVIGGMDESPTVVGVVRRSN